MTKTPQKHAAVIKAWADGETIEYKSGDIWRICINPEWNSAHEYRVYVEPKSAGQMLYESWREAIKVKYNTQTWHTWDDISEADKKLWRNTAAKYRSAIEAENV